MNNKYRIDENAILPNNNSYFDYYKIKKGDTLYDIARRYNINPDLLASLNGLNNNDYIYPEQTILIPKSNYSYYITKKGDTLSGVSEVFGIKKEELLQENPIVYLLEGQLLVKRAK